MRLVPRGLVLVAAVSAIGVASGRPAFGQPAGTAFTYQGRLTDNGTAVTGPIDLQCVLYTAPVGGAQVGPIVTANDVPAANGLFTVNLDFGTGAFAGSVRYLEIGVRPGASTGAYTILGARQEIKPAPHAVFTQAAPWVGLTGMPAGFADGIDNDSGGDITSITVGTGLTGGGATGAVSIGLDFPTLTLNHNHFGQTWNGSQASGLDINNNAASGAGLRAAATATTGAGVGVFGVGSASAGIGVDGTNSAATGLAIGVRGVTGSTQGQAVHGLAVATTGTTRGVYGQVNSRSGTGVEGVAVSTEPGGATGVSGQTSAPFGTGVVGRALATSGNNWGVVGSTNSAAGIGVQGTAPAGGLAGFFGGAVQVNGTLSKSAGSFKIDHPLDPENKYLYHSFVESPDMKNVYDGVVVTDANGRATVELPEWFEALNRDFRYQLTVVDDADAHGFVQVKVARKIAANRFQIRTSAPGIEVSWQVTGIRQDTYAEKHRIPVEQPKPPDERGLYIHPEDWGLPPERGVDCERKQLTNPPFALIEEN